MRSISLMKPRPKGVGGRNRRAFCTREPLHPPTPSVSIITSTSKRNDKYYAKSIYVQIKEVDDRERYQRKERRIRK